MESSDGAPASERRRRRSRDHDEERQHVGRGVEEVVALRDADRLQRRAERAGAAEEQRRAEAGERIPAREDHQRHRHQALAGGDALVPASRIIEREIGAADAGEHAAGRGREQAHPVDVIAHGARRVGAVADGADDEADLGVAKAPPEQNGQRDADQEEDIDLERRLNLRDRRPGAEGNGRQVRRDRLDVGLAEEEGEAHAEEHQRDADGDVVDARELADPAVERAEAARRQARRPARRSRPTTVS